MSIWFDKPRQKWRYKFIVQKTTYQDYCLKEDGTPARNRREAKAIEEAKKVDVRRALKAGAAPAPSVYTVAEAAVARLEQAQEDLKRIDWVRRALDRIVEFFGANAPLSSIDDLGVRRFRTKLACEVIVQWTGGPQKFDAENGGAAFFKRRKSSKVRSKRTVNRYLDQLSAMLKLAHDTRVNGRRLLADLPKIPRFDEPKDVPNPVPEDHLGTIMDHAAEHLVSFLAIVRLTGFREQEVLNLEVDDILWSERRVRLYPDRTKSGDGYWQPVSELAIEILRGLADEAAAAGQTHLILYRDPVKGLRPVSSVRKAWLAALRRAGLTGRYKAHGVRGSYITALAHIAPGAMVQQLARHKTWATTNSTSAWPRRRSTRSSRRWTLRLRGRHRSGSKVAHRGRSRNETAQPDRREIEGSAAG